jgi:hypothetical protein
MNAIDTTAIETREIDGQYWQVITDASGTDCLFPTDGPGSIEDIISRFGDDLDAVCQSAARYL